MNPNSQNDALRRLIKELRAQAIRLSDDEDWEGPGLAAQPVKRIEWQAADLLERQCGPEGAGWISVEDRVPENDGWQEVIGLSDTGVVSAVEYWGEEKKWWPCNGNGEYWADELHDITHWMPLPAAPQPEAGDSDGK